MIQVNFLAQMPVFLLENTCSGASKYKRAKGLAKYVRNHKVSLYLRFFFIYSTIAGAKNIICYAEDAFILKEVALYKCTLLCILA